MKNPWKKKPKGDVTLIDCEFCTKGYIGNKRCNACQGVGKRYVVK